MFPQLTGEGPAVFDVDVVLILLRKSGGAIIDGPADGLVPFRETLLDDFFRPGETNEGGSIVLFLGWLDDGDDEAADILLIDALPVFQLSCCCLAGVFSAGAGV